MQENAYISLKGVKGCNAINVKNKMNMYKMQNEMCFQGANSL